MAHKVLFLNTQLFPGDRMGDIRPAALLQKRLEYRVLTTSVTQHTLRLAPENLLKVLVYENWE